MPYKDVETQKAYLRAYDREYYRKNREHLLKKQKEKNQRHLEKVGTWLNEYKIKDYHVRAARKNIRQLCSFIIVILKKKISPLAFLGVGNTAKSEY